MKPRSKMLLAAAGVIFASLGYYESHAPAFAQTGREPTESPKKNGLKPPGKGSALKGRAVFDETCSVCHFNASNQKKIGPGLKGIYRNGKFEDGRKVDDKSMRVWIETGGKDMPAFKETLTPKQIDDLIAFLHTL